MISLPHCPIAPLLRCSVAPVPHCLNCLNCKGAYKQKRDQG
jgi:hypothetical protein